MLCIIDRVYLTMGVCVQAIHIGTIVPHVSLETNTLAACHVAKAAGGCTTVRVHVSLNYVTPSIVVFIMIREPGDSVAVVVAMVVAVVVGHSVLCIRL